MQPAADPVEPVAAAAESAAADLQTLVLDEAQRRLFHGKVQAILEAAGDNFMTLSFNNILQQIEADLVTPPQLLSCCCLCHCCSVSVPLMLPSLQFAHMSLTVPTGYFNGRCSEGILEGRHQ